MLSRPNPSYSSMRVLLLSAQLPTNEEKTQFLRTAGNYASQTTTILFGFLATSASAEQWPAVSALSEGGSSAARLRPLKPNDDNYQSFTGAKWRPPTTTASNGKNGDESDDLPPVVHAALLGGGGTKNHNNNNDSDGVVYPRYDYCASCTKHPAPQQCSRCKFVRYCNRSCQAKHWKHVHRHSCEPARAVSLREAMLGHEGYHVSPEECRRLETSLAHARRQEGRQAEADDLLQCMEAYFAASANLGGCFVL